MLRQSPISSCSAYSASVKQLYNRQTAARRANPCPAGDQAVPECACKQQTRELQQQLARNVVAYARRLKGGSKRSKGSSGVQEPETAAAADGTGKGAAADVSGLLQALVQLASRSTIMLGSHQAYAILESIEAQLQQQSPQAALAPLPLDRLASGLWAISRLQLTPQQATVAAVAQHLLQHQQQQQQQGGPRGAASITPSTIPSSSGNGGGGGASAVGSNHQQQQQQQQQGPAAFMAAALRTRLASCSPRTFGTFCYSLNFFLHRDPHFWAAAAAVSLQHLPQLKPANISNLLQGLALSGWVLDPGALGPQQVSSSRLGVQQQQQQQQWGTEEVGGSDRAGEAQAAAPPQQQQQQQQQPQEFREEAEGVGGHAPPIAAATAAALRPPPPAAASAPTLPQQQTQQQLPPPLPLPLPPPLPPLPQQQQQLPLPLPPPLPQQQQQQQQQWMSPPPPPPQQQQPPPLQPPLQQQQWPPFPLGGSAAVLALLQALEGSLLTKPSQLRLWRLRDISQLVQSYALLGFRCGPLFAVIAQHLTEDQQPLHEQQQQQQQQQQLVRSQPAAAAAQQQQQWGQQPLLQPMQPAAASSSVLSAAYSPYSSSSSSGGQTPAWSSSPSRSPASNSNPNSNAKPWHDKGRGPSRLAECRAGDAVGIAWGFVHAFCPQRLLLHELAGVLAARAGQLHAADVSRLLWAYATAEVVDVRMLSAVTSAVVEEMLGVRPRTAAGAVWALGMMRFQAPAFLEAAYDRLAACLEATPVPAAAAAAGPNYSSAAAGVASSPSATAQEPSPAAAAAAAAAVPPSMLQQLYQGSGTQGWLSGGPQVHSGSSSSGELALTRTYQQQQKPWTHEQQQQQQQQQPQHDQEEAGGQAGTGQQQQQWVNPAVAAWPSTQQQQQQYAPYPHPHPQQQQQQQWGVGISHRDISEAVWAAGRLRHFNAAFFAALRPRLRGLLGGFTEGQLVDVLWGCARLQLYDGGVLDAAAEELIRRVDRLSPAVVALSAWSYTALRHTHPALFGALSGRVARLGHEGRLSVTDARQLLYAAAKLGVREARLVKACVKVLKAHLPGPHVSVVVSSLWAAAVAGHFDEDMFAGSFAYLSSLPLKVLKPLQLLQLFQATTLLQDALGPAASVRQLQLPPALHQAAQRQWLATTRRGPLTHRSSGFAADVGRVLQEQLRLRVRFEARTSDGLFSADMAVTWNGRLVAVEVDGPEHFSRNAPHTLLGSTAAKHACLQARGWAVLSVPFHEWNSISAAVAQLDGGAEPGPEQQQQQQQQQEAWSVEGLPGDEFDEQQQQRQQQQRRVQRRQLRRPDASLPTDADAAADAADTAAEPPRWSFGTRRAAVSAGVAPERAGQLAAARASYLRAALSRAVQLAEVPRSIL